MKVIVAPDSYKGSLTALEVSKCMEKGVNQVFPHSKIKSFPLADGGEGTVESIVNNTNGNVFTALVTGPLGDQVEAKWGVTGDGKTAIIEMAEASGLLLIPEENLDPFKATTFGTGQLIKKALDHGCSKIIVGIGGSATNDGGAGMASALGVKFLDEHGKSLPLGGQPLINLKSINIDDIDQRINDVEIVVASDVSNPLCGPDGASAIFGPQKGATPSMVETLDKSLHHFGTRIKSQLSKDIMDVPGAGGAGGLGGGLMAFLGAKLQTGIEIVLETINFEKELNNSNLVIVGEGKTDKQTAFGKAPMGVGLMAKKHGVPVICVSGSLSEGYQNLADKGIDAFFSSTKAPATVEEVMKNAETLVEEATKNIMQVYKLGMEHK